MIRHTLLAFSLAFLALPAQAQEWHRARLKSLGIEFDLPPGFVTQNGSETGALLAGPNGAVLAIGGGDLSGLSFRSTMRHNIKQDEADGWRITYDRVTDRWASYSGVRAGQIRYVRAFPICGDRLAVFVLDYNKSEKISYDPVVVRMVRSLKVTSC